MKQQKELLQLIVTIGETLLQSGGEIFRVQQTMELIAAAYQLDSFHAYVLTNCIMVSASEGSEVRYVQRSGMHMGKIIAVNNLSRRITKETIAPQQAQEELQKIVKIPPMDTPLRILACAIGAGCFAWLLGGEIIDALAAFVIGALLQPLRMQLEKTNNNIFIVNMLCAIWVAVCSVAAIKLLQLGGFTGNLDMVIIGGIIPLVPGIALTNAVRDVVNSDYLSGTIRAVEALLIAAAIAAGVGIVLAGIAPMMEGLL